jgi:hypothetical protein
MLAGMEDYSSEEEAQPTGMCAAMCVCDVARTAKRARASDPSMGAAGPRAVQVEEHDIQESALDRGFLRSAPRSAPRSPISLGDSIASEKEEAQVSTSIARSPSQGYGSDLEGDAVPSCLVSDGWSQRSN